MDGCHHATRDTSNGYKRNYVDLQLATNERVMATHNKLFFLLGLGGLWCLTPLLTIFQ